MSKSLSTAYPHSLTLRQELNHELINSWYLDDIDKRLTKEYYILHWTADYFNTVNINGTVRRLGIDYTVVYHNCLVSDVLTDKDKQVKLSFRSPKDEFELPNYVLVSRVKGCK